MQYFKILSSIIIESKNLKGGKAMIVNMVRGNVLETPHSHIAFAVNAEGHNDVGFAGQVGALVWAKLTKTGKMKLGEIISHKSNLRHFMLSFAIR